MSPTTLLTVAYDGTDFAGCPDQPGQRTIVSVLAEALARAGVQHSALELLSRTDAGVHARANRAVVQHPRDRPAQPLADALNGHLPADLRVVHAQRITAPPVALRKHYSYRIDTTRWADPLRARTAWRPPLPLSGPILARLARTLPGERDWAAFRRRGETRDDLVRRIEQAQWTPIEQGWRLDLVGAGFPYRLVRSLVGAMAHVAHGSATEQDFADALSGQTGPITQQQAPARGLCLEGIELA